MCYFISLVVRGGDRAEIAAVMARHRRAAKSAGNPSVRDVLRSGEEQFLTTMGHCDCNSVLAGSAGVSNDNVAAEAKARRRGWSDAKLARWRAEREKADTRAQERARQQYSDSVEFWTQILRDLLALSQVESAGLLIHFYEEGVDAEEFDVRRRTTPLHAVPSALDNLEDGCLLMVSPQSTR